MNLKLCKFFQSNAWKKFSSTMNKIAFFLPVVFVIFIFLIITTGASLGISNYVKPFVCTSFILSLMGLVFAAFENSTKFFRENFGFCLFIGFILSFLYAAFRVQFFPDSATHFENIGTAIIIIAGFFIPVFNKK